MDSLWTAILASSCVLVGYSGTLEAWWHWYRWIRPWLDDCLPWNPSRQTCCRSEQTVSIPHLQGHWAGKPNAVLGRNGRLRWDVRAWVIRRSASARLGLFRERRLHRQLITHSEDENDFSLNTYKKFKAVLIWRIADSVSPCKFSKQNINKEAISDTRTVSWSVRAAISSRIPRRALSYFTA